MDNINIETAIEKFLNYCDIERNYSENTIITYSIALKQFVEYLTKEYDLVPAIEEIDYKTIRPFIPFLYQQKQSKISLRLKISALKSFFKFLLKKGIIDKNPAALLSYPKKDKKLPSYLVKKETESYFENYKNIENLENPIEARNLALSELLYSSGLRISEALSITRNEIDFQNKTIRVIGKGRKERIVPLGQKAVEALKKYLLLRSKIKGCNKTDFIFITKSGMKLTATDGYRIIHKSMQAVTESKQKSPHIFRHSFATHLLDNGADIQSVSEMLGHSSLSSTQVYTHLSIEKLKETYKKAHPKAENLITKENKIINPDAS